jgi:MerR family transcriptional regulator, light-induced transcriptional regulator
VDGVMRIGELSRRTGVSPELLRAWEQRYGLLEPTRSRGGFRLYSADDEARVRRTTALIAEGLAAAEAARQAVGAPVVPRRTDAPLLDDLRDALRVALDGFNATAAHTALDRLLAVVSVESAIVDVLIPYLQDLGERWADGTASVAQEHFASHLIRGRLLGLTRDWGGGARSAVLACLPGEAHDLGLIMFGILIARRGWSVTFLGADTPFDSLDKSVRALAPSLVVLATVTADRFQAHADEIHRVAEKVPTAVAGPVEEDAVTNVGARPLPGGVAAAVHALTTAWP